MKKAADSVLKIEISLKSILVFFAIIVAVAVLWQIKVILFMLFTAFIINSALRPSVDKLEKYKIPRLVSVILIYILLFSIVSIAVITIFSKSSAQFINLIEQFPTIIGNFGIILSNFIEKVANMLSSIPGIGDIFSTDGVQGQFADYFNDIDSSEFTNLFGNLVTGTISIINSAIYLIFAIFTVIMVSIYMLTNESDIYEGVLNLLPKRKGKKYGKLIKKIEEKLGNWLRGQLLLMLSVGFFTWLGLYLPSLFIDGYNLHEFALPIALLAGLLEAIPNIGPFITSFVAVIIAAGANPDNPLLPITYVVVLFSMIQWLENTILVPKIMQKAVGLDPVLTMLAILAALILFNIIGALLVIPFLAMVHIILQFEIDEKSVIS